MVIRDFRRFRAAITVAIALSIALPAYGNDLLADDDFSFDTSEVIEEEHSWLDDTRFTLEQALSQGRNLEQLRSTFRFEYEASPWEGAFVKLDNKLTYFWHKDRQARQQQTDYGHNKLQEAWLQLSEQACFAKLGRQTLFWGSVEGTFAVDVVSPFDYTEPLLTDFTSIRLAQDMLTFDCFSDQQQWQVFFQPRARLDSFQHRQDGALKQLEDDLNEEFGLRFIQSWEGLDLHLMYARLYGNTPIPSLVSVEVPRFDFIGVTLVKAIRRLLIEVDIGFKQNQLEAFSGEEKDQLEAALGFEYTTANNHQFNGGVWLFDTQAQSPQEQFKSTQTWTAGWNKTYLNDDLTLSLLGSYIETPQTSSVTLQSQYKWDDFWTLTTALGYADTQQTITGFESGWQVHLNIKWQY